MAYLLEKSRPNHLGRTFLKDGRTVKETMPIITFMKNIKDSYDLLFYNQAFYDFIANGFQNENSRSKYLEKLKRYELEADDMILGIRGNGGLVQIPDKTYWLNQLNNYTNKVNSGKMSKFDAGYILLEKFMKMLDACISGNEKEAKRLGVDIPKIER